MKRYTHKMGREDIWIIQRAASEVITYKKRAAELSKE